VNASAVAGDPLPVDLIVIPETNTLLPLNMTQTPVVDEEVII
jgi:hypothetical protein